MTSVDRMWISETRTQPRPHDFCLEWVESLSEQFSLVTIKVMGGSQPCVDVVQTGCEAANLSKRNAGVRGTDVIIIPSYLTELLQYHKPSRSTRSSASHLLSIPRHNLSFGARALSVAAPKIWNSIPLHIRQSQTYSSCRRHLKTYYFLSAHLAP